MQTEAYKHFKQMAVKGDLRVFRSGKIVSDHVYRTIVNGMLCLICKRTRKRVQVARLILFLFTGKLPSGVRFLDDDPANCALSNIRPVVGISREPVLRMLRTGQSLAAIAAEFGVSRQSVHAYCKKHGLLPEREQIQAKIAVTKQQNKSEEAEKLAQQRRIKFGRTHVTGLTALERAQSARFVSKRRNNARSSGTRWDWKLQLGDIEWPTHCPILGVELDYFAKRAAPNSPSFDRIDPAKGYVKGNVAVISYRANVVKNDGTAAEHRAIAKYMDSHLKRP